MIYIFYFNLKKKIEFGISGFAAFPNSLHLIGGNLIV